MHHHLNLNDCNLNSSWASFPSEKNLFLQEGNSPGNLGLNLSTEAKPRLKWTHDLHEHFVEAVKQLGGAEKATPKTVMRLMRIPGVTLYHLKSHLQKYRLSKNLQVQTNGGTQNNVKVPKAALDKTSSEGNGLLVNNINVGPHDYKTMQMNEALQIQMEVQRNIHEQLEVQRHLQIQIEAQGRYLQAVLEKAQETLGKQNSGCAGLETAKTQLSELVSKVSNECFSSGFPCLERSHGSHNKQEHAAQTADFSMDSCLTTCLGSQNLPGLRGAYHDNSSLGTREIQERTGPGQIRSGWHEDLNGCRIFSQSKANDPTHSTLPVSTGFSDLTMSRSNQKHTPEGSSIYEACQRRSDEHNSHLDRASYKGYAFRQKSTRSSSELELPTSAAAQLDLNASCNGFDLNGFGWS